MDKLSFLIVFVVSLGLLCKTANAIRMEKLADRKICADKYCSYVISVAEALDDYTASDCRFINLKKGQIIYIYFKLKPVEGAGVFWSGSNVPPPGCVPALSPMIPGRFRTHSDPELDKCLQVYGDRYVDQMGIIGYFPSNHVNETQIFEKKTIEMPTTDMDFFCA